MKGTFLTIVIPHFNEPPKAMLPLLCSIGHQLGVDFGELEVLVVDDCSDAEDLGGPAAAEVFALLPHLDLRVIRMAENRGPGVARQTGLDQARGEYVMFCDADDTLHSVGVLGAFLAELRGGAFDILASPWLEELRTDTGTAYITHENENTWMHGKAFRTAFLRDNDIRFHDTLRVHEDSYFLSLAARLTERRGALPVTSYVWRWGEDTITRRDGGAYTYEAMPTLYRAIGESIGLLERRGRTEGLPYAVVQLLLYGYFTGMQDHWAAPDKAGLRRAAEAALAAALQPYLGYLAELPAELFPAVYNEERAKHFASGVETERFEDFTARIGLTQKK